MGREGSPPHPTSAAANLGSHTRPPHRVSRGRWVGGPGSWWVQVRPHCRLWVQGAITGDPTRGAQSPQTP